MSRWRRVVGLPLLVAVGCGVPADSGPRRIPPDKVPFDLLEPAETVPVTTTVPVAGVVSIFLVSGERLAELRRSSAAPTTPESALSALLAGPTPEEAARGLRTAIGTTLSLTPTRAGAGQVGVELGPSFTSAGGSEQILAIAQLVYTMTALPGVSGVAFTVDGRDVEVPKGDGTLTRSPLGRDAFPAAAPA